MRPQALSVLRPPPGLHGSSATTPLTGQDQYREVAARSSHTAEDADGCIEGSLGCKHCPWVGGWAQKHLRAYGPHGKVSRHLSHQWGRGDPPPDLAPVRAGAPGEAA